MGLMATVKNSTSQVVLPEFVDQRGKLMFAEMGRHIPFEVRRIFAIYDVPPGSHRAGHAHRAQHQFLIMLAGECKVVVGIGSDRSEIRLAHPTQGLHVPPRTWIDLEEFSAGSVCLVLASGLFDEADYIRDVNEFQRLIAGA